MSRANRAIPDFHVKPLMRLQTPTILNPPNNHPSFPLRARQLHPYAIDGNPLHELVYDPNTQVRPRVPQFSARFESGNLGQVFLTGLRRYEIHLLPDPSPVYSALWYFFQVEGIPPGEYSFTIVGFFRDAPLHRIGVQPVMLSKNAMRNGIGWQRFGDNINFWKWKQRSIYFLSFTFNVRETDTMYFSYLYPYTYSDLKRFLSHQPRSVVVSSLCRSHGGIDIPVIFWDGDQHQCITLKQLMGPQRLSRETKKPLIVMAARHHPGEPPASYAMEGFLTSLFSGSPDAERLLSRFSFLIIPMVNVDGVICGYYRPSLTGYDMNRSWVSPSRKRNPVEHTVVTVLDKLVKNRPLVFLLDYHGHSTQCNAFTYCVDNELMPFNDLQCLFPRLMAKNSSVFNEDGGGMLEPNAYPSTMRVALHHRYQIPFAYTLEMSFGGWDIGPQGGTQLTPQEYRELGHATVTSMATMLLDHVPLNTIIKRYVPPIVRQQHDEWSD
jgi:hypothetical protein